jgi:hypothetical protein
MLLHTILYDIGLYLKTSNPLSMDFGNGGLLMGVMGGLLGGITAWTFMRPELPQTTCVNECRRIKNELSPEAYMQCVRKCLNIKNETVPDLYPRVDGSWGIEKIKSR